MKRRHGGSVWKNISLLFRGLLQVAAFLGVWVGYIYRGTAWAGMFFWVGLILLIYCMVFHLFFPLLRLFR